MLKSKQLKLDFHYQLRTGTKNIAFLSYPNRQAPDTSKEVSGVVVFMVSSCLACSQAQAVVHGLRHDQLGIAVPGEKGFPYPFEKCHHRCIGNALPQ